MRAWHRLKESAYEAESKNLRHLSQDMYGKLQHALMAVEQESAFQHAQVHMSAIMTISHISAGKPLQRRAASSAVLRGAETKPQHARHLVVRLPQRVV